MSDNSPRLDLPYIQSAQAQKHVTHNEALRVLDAIVQLAVIGFDATTPPSLAEEGDVYALGTGASGVWTDHDGDVALYVDGYWQFHSPQPGWLATLAGTTEIRVWSGSTWEMPDGVSFDNLDGVGVNTTHDATNRLAVSSPATLLTHEGSGHQLKVNKASASDTASLLFQDDWSGRAEMGLAGDDDFHIKVSADGSIWNDALQIEAATGKVSFSQSEMAGLNFAAISDEITATAVDVFVYDTSRDSDGGAWRHRCQHTSWYRETLNTTTRGARRGFPAVAVIVAEETKVTIHDGDDPALPMWMVLEQSSSNLLRGNGSTGCSSVAATGAEIIIGDGNNYAGNSINFLLDGTNPKTDLRQAVYRGNIAQRNDGLGSEVGTPLVTNKNVNSVAMTALPGAPVDPATGLPVPTIAVATAAGVSVLRDTGTVANSSATGAAYNARFDGARLRYQQSGVGQFCSRAMSGITASWTPSAAFSASSTPAMLQAVASGSKLARRAAAGSTGITQILENEATSAASMAAYVTATYNTGWMVGDIKGAWLADTETGDLVGGSVADRSVGGNSLAVTGTLSRTPVATGAEAVGYSGFSASNYLTGTNAAFFSTLYALCWVQTSGVWEFKHGAVSGGAIDGVTISGTTLTVAGTKPKALFRLTATVPTAAQLAKIEADERALFQPGAACTLYGASDAVTALADDPVTGLLHVGTSAGRSDFQGLCRVANTTTAVTTAISAAGGNISEQ